MSETSLRRFLVEGLEIRGGMCIVKGREAHHVLRVLRMGKGDELMLLDGKGDRFVGEIRSVSSDAVNIEIKKSLGRMSPASLEITLCQAVIKSTSMDDLIRKTSELGVTRILPFFSERSVVHLNGERRSKKQYRWKEIARNAAKQCKRDRSAEIGLPAPFEEQLALAGEISGLKVILWEKERSRDLKGLLESHGPASEVVGMVGPEGGFARKEALKALEAGFVPVSMGSRILRAETAAMVLVTILQYEWGDLQPG